MTKTEIISRIAAALESLDVLRGSEDVDSSLRKKLDARRKELSVRRKVLTKKVLNENSKKYIVLTETIASINNELLDTINDVENIAATIKALDQFVVVLDKLIGMAVSAVA